jgi:pSer/pThr/pTyr-binding forkhead associated (FHA) protein
MCPHCGKPSRPGSIFCQHCGKRMSDDGSTAALGPAAGSGRLPDTVAATPVATPPPAGPTATCAACQAVNPATLNFCKMCGEPLRPSGPSAAVAPPPPSAAAAKRGSLPSALAAVVGGPAQGGARGPQKTMLAAGMPRKPATPAPTPQPAPPAPPPAVAAGKPTRTCPSCSGATPVGFAFCQHCGVRIDASGPVVLEDPAALSSPHGVTISDAGVADTLAGAGEVVPLIKRRIAGGPSVDGAAWAQLVSVLRDGSDGERHPLVEDAVDIGRTDGGLTFDDRYLAPRHARLERRGKDRADVVVIPLETTNGVYCRLRPGEVVTLVDGDHLLLGKEVLRFETVDPEERNQGPAMQHGVHLFGSPVRSPWGRLRQLVQSGVSRDIHHLVALEVVLGREEGDLRWSDDEFMSRRHARLTNRDGRAELQDLESSNGTFVRLRGERPLRRGDMVRMGNQLFRFEPL